MNLGTVVFDEMVVPITRIHLARSSIVLTVSIRLERDLDLTTTQWAIFASDGTQVAAYRNGFVEQRQTIRKGVNLTMEIPLKFLDVNGWPQVKSEGVSV